ncbi:MAG: dTMP kinase [Nitrospinota bacterium]|nr:dTMP kinase [Nitrospinota bacterium]
MGKGILITFEGTDGCGKTTQISLLKDYLSKRGKPATVTREPGGTSIGDIVRRILLHSGGIALNSLTETLLYEGCRAQLVRELIQPALERGETVLCDRFADSTIAYQGYGRGIEIETIKTLNRIATDGLTPTITLLFDIDPKIALQRTSLRKNSNTGGENEERFEKEGLEFHKKVRQGFKELAKEEPERIKVIDANRTPEEIHLEVLGHLKRLLSV